MGKFFANLLLIIFIALLQVSFFSSFSYPANQINLILTVLIFVLFLADFKASLYFAIGCGIILDLYSLSFFGFFASILLLTIFIVYLLFKNFFTNKSLYSLLVLGILGVIIYNALLIIYYFFFSLWKMNIYFGQPNGQFFLSALWQLIFAVIILLILFLITHFISDKWKSVFLVR